MKRGKLVVASVLTLLISSFQICIFGEANSTTESIPPKLLWAIGTQDNKCLEFALAPTNYENYGEDPYFMVGQSSPAEDWCYIHPGPKDKWAQDIPHIFTIVFFLKSVDIENNSLLNLYLLEFNKQYPPNLTVYVNGVNFPVRLPPGNGTDEFLLTFDGSLSNSKKISLSFPSSFLRLGENVIQFTVSGGSWFIYDAVQLYTPEKVELEEPQKTVLRIGKPVPLPLIKFSQEKELRTIKIPVHCYGEPFQGKLSITGRDAMDINLNTGWNDIYYEIQEVPQDTFASIEIKKEDKSISTRDFVISPAEALTIYLIPHSHNDIGYTHVQTEVEKIQHQNIAKALDLIEQTNDYPLEAQFHWSAEVLWAVKSFWNKSDDNTKQRIKKAVEEGKFELPALFTNQLTGLCNGEELTHLLDEAKKLSRELNTNIDTALITDIPGYTWGLIPVFAQTGVKYFSIGPNLDFRIGNILNVWGDKPFYWISPCGKYKVLTWIGLTGYAYFFCGTDCIPSQTKLYLAKLVERNYPYDMAISRYSIASDNGPPDEKLPEFVKQWNQEYKTPKFVISTAGKALKTFEEKYGKELPAYAGEITPYWEDGSVSSARETAINRDTARKLMSLETLFALWLPEKYPAQKFAEAWENVVLYDEHTWGAHNSITEPDSPFVKEQWTIKQSFAINAANIANELLNTFTENFKSNEDTVSQILIFNPLPFAKTEIVAIPADWKRKGDKIIKDGMAVASQRLKSNELVFIARDIPPFGYAVFTVEEGTSEPPKDSVSINENTIQNSHLEITIDPKTGTINSLKRKSDGKEFIKEDSIYKTNEYLYAEGRSPENLKRASNVQISIKENGPLVGSINILYQSAPGAKEIQSEIILYTDSDFVEIVNSIDKEDIRTPEAVHYSFAFNIQNPEIRYQTPFAVIHLPEQQLPGSCKNYLTARDWIDISNDNMGISLITPDTPMLEIGKITVDPKVVGWKKAVLLEPTVFSYVMNNYWETNFKASQDGLHKFRYYLVPHEKCNLQNLDVISKQLTSKLVAVPIANVPKLPACPVQVSPSWVIYHLKYLPEETAYLFRLFNPTSEKVQVDIKTPANYTLQVLQAELNKTANEPASKFTSTLEPWEFTTLILKK